MSIYNFAKSKEKNLDDTHTEMRLKEQHEEKAPEVVTEKQLEKKDREDETDFVVTEKQLEKVRTGGAEVIIEKNLNDSKGKFGSNFRNDEAFMGDINKLEEKRLSGKKTEDEKYEASSESPKKVRWWDGLKKAQTDTVIKTASFYDDDEAGSDVITDIGDDNEFESTKRFERMKEMGLDPEEEGIIPERTDTIQDVQDVQDVSSPLEESITPQPIKPLTSNEVMSAIPHTIWELEFNPDDFGGDTIAMKAAALEKILEARPELKDVLSTGNISVKGGKVKAALMGDQYFEPKVEEEAVEMAPTFSKLETEEIDAGGTPMQVGRVVLGPQAEAMDEDSLMSGIIDFIESKTGLRIPENAIQINLSKGEAAFAFDPEAAPTTAPIENPTIDSSVPPEEPDMFDTDEEDELMDEEDELMDEDEEPSQVITKPENLIQVPEPPAPPSTMAKSEYDFPIVIADSKDSKKK